MTELLFHQRMEQIISSFLHPQFGLIADTKQYITQQPHAKVDPAWVQ